MARDRIDGLHGASGRRTRPGAGIASGYKGGETVLEVAGPVAVNDSGDAAQMILANVPDRIASAAGATLDRNLTHPLLMDLAASWLPQGQVWDRMTMPLTLLLDLPRCWGIHTYIERPLIALGRRVADRPEIGRFARGRR